MVSLSDPAIDMFNDDFTYQGHISAGLYTHMLASRPDSIYSMPFTQPFDQSLEESYSSNAMSTYASYPPVTAYRPSFYNTPNFIISGSQDVIKQQYLMPTPEGSPAHSSLNSFENPPSALSSSGASVPSAASSAMGSPYSNGGLMAQGIDSWSDAATQGLGIGPSIVQQDGFGNESFLQDASLSAFVDPSLIQPFPTSNNVDSIPCSMTTMPPAFHSPQCHPPSPAPSESSNRSPRPGSAHMKTGSGSSYLHTTPYQPYQRSSGTRRPSISSSHSRISVQSSYRGSPAGSSGELDDEAREKGKCTECGKAFKDLKAHLLTHQNERPEKCPIITCEYNKKGFSRKYDKNRHTLTHYKGTMVCGFCPGSGSAAEKSFNRADVFKRHLTSVHNVEQAPPNSRKKNSSGSSGTNNFPTYPADATGKCSTCGLTFSNAQDFYEHLDECVLRIVQQEDPFAAINERNINSVSNDEAVQQTMRANALPLNSNYANPEENLDESEEAEEDEDYERDDEKDDTWKASGGNATTGRTPSTRARTGIKRSGSGSGTLTKGNQQMPAANSRGCITKIRRSTSGGKGTFTHSKGGVPLLGKGKKRRKNYPPSWSSSADKMPMKKRGLYVFDGPRRLCKDDMMLSTEYEVRMPLQDGKYFTDLDDLTVRRAEAFHDATEEEKGPGDVDIQELMS
ncbi:MAG: hypothetical protein M1839_009188 [Geoglossum umbratile]|nr:MAG: hypothetical protein M1839_009188 [Geoglossum umbratile]